MRQEPLKEPSLSAGGGYARSVAISSTGELIRDTGDRRLLAALLSVFDDVDQPGEFRGQACAAMLRGVGKEWKDVPGVSSEAWHNSPDVERLRVLRQRASGPD